METSPRVNLTPDQERMADVRHRWAAMQRRIEWEQQHPWRRRWLRLRSWVADRLTDLGERLRR